MSLYYPNFIKYSWLDRGSDERQYCSPGVDLPISSITRSKYGDYPEYHTSLDNFDFVTEKGLNQSLDIYLKCIEVFENEKFIPKQKEKILNQDNLKQSIKENEKSIESKYLS